MARKLVIQLPPTFSADTADDCEINWAYLDDDIAITTNQGQLSELSTELRSGFQGQIVLLLAGESVYLTEIELSSRQSKHMAKIIPFLLEESLLDDIDSLHFSSGKKGAAGYYPVAVINRQSFKDLLNLLASFAINPTVVTSELTCLPVSKDNEWALLVDNTRGYLKTSINQGLCFLREQVNAVVRIAASQQKVDNAELSLEFIGASDLERDNTICTLIESEMLSIEGIEKVQIEKRATTSGFFTLLENLKTIPHNHLLNLLQGEFKVKQNKSTSLIPWKPVAIITSIYFVSLLLLTAVEGFYYQNLAKKKQQETLQLFQELAPGLKPLRIRERVKVLLRQQGGKAETTNFMALLTQAGAAFSEINHSNNEIIFHRINFEERLGELRIDLIATSYAYIETFKAAIEKNGYTVQIYEANANKQGYKGRIGIRGES